MAMRRVMITAVCVSLVWSGIDAPRASGQNRDGDAVVIVNGEGISRTQLINLLMESHGLSGMQQLILLQVARQEAKKRGVRVGAADVDNEYEHALDRIAAESGLTGEEASRENKLKALQVVLDQRGISHAEFMVGMERNANLRKIVDKDFQVNEATLKEEFARTFGEKVVVRHIQLPVNDNRLLTEALEQLNSGADFAELARRLSRNPESAARGGELPAFTYADANIPPLLREAAFALKPDEVSGAIRTDNWYHILKLERRIAPESQKFEDVRAEVEKALRERVIPQRMNELAAELFDKANVRVIDSNLRKKFEELKKKSAAANP